MFHPASGSSSHHRIANRDSHTKNDQPMLSGRGFLSGMAAAGLAPSLRPTISRENPHSITPVQFEVPERACDCHVHVFGDPSRFPFAASASKIDSSHRGSARQWLETIANHRGHGSSLHFRAVYDSRT